MVARSSLVAMAAVPVLMAVTLYYVEHFGALYLPGPSFKKIGPPIIPTPLAKHEGVYASTSSLHQVEILFKGQILGSESVAVSSDGALYMLDKFGIVWKSANGGTPERVIHLGAGRPLGFHFDKDDNLVICNAGVGLQMLEKDTGKLVLLSSEAPVSQGGTQLAPIQYADDLAFASDGAIYFTDASEIPPGYNSKGFYDTMASYILDVFQGEKTGRLLKYDPSTKETSLVSCHLHFANGVALGPDEDSVLVVETSSVKITRHWLKGPKAGQEEVFIDNLPGYPDGLTDGSDGTYWISLVTLNSPALEFALRSRITRWLAPRLPDSLKKAKLGTAIIQVSSEGKVLRYLDDNDGSHVFTVSAVTETADKIYLGSLGGDFVSSLSKSRLSAPFKS